MSASGSCVGVVENSANMFVDCLYIVEVGGCYLDKCSDDVEIEQNEVCGRGRVQTSC
jgi:hypothetical protein